jgi:hypothetical protein
MIALGDIPVREELTAPVLEDKETVLNNTLPKFPNLVSNKDGPLTWVVAITISVPNPINIAKRMDRPLPFPINLAYAIGKDRGIISIKNIS